MWRELALTLAAAVLCTPGLACDSEGSAPPPGGASAGDVDRLARAVCGAYRDCCQKAGHGLEPLAACESVFKQEITSLRYIEQGTAHFDPVGLDRCIAAFDQAARECTAPEDLACSGIFVGTRDEGAPCANVAECRTSSAAVCLILQQPDGGRGTGTCRQTPRATLGQPCLGTCASDEGCRSTYTTSQADPPLGRCYEADGLYCEASTCARYLALGASCTYDEQCGPTGACSEESGAGGTCVERVAAGSACERSSQCQKPLGCVGGRCGPRVVATDKICIEGDLD